jgi:hypothetical protein
MLIAESELQDFIHFLRVRCKVDQVLRFSPPNAEGEVFRAIAGEHLIFGCTTHEGKIAVSTDPYFKAQLAETWRKQSNSLAFSGIVDLSFRSAAPSA